MRLDTFYVILKKHIINLKMYIVIEKISDLYSEQLKIKNFFF